MESKVCVVCNIEKNIDNFHNKYRECKRCNIKRSPKRYRESKDKLTNQRKLYYEKIEICYLQNLKCINRTETLIHNKLKILTIK